MYRCGEILMRTIVMMLIAALPGIASAQDYPTLDIVENVIFCMEDMGGQSQDNLYACTCRFDVVASGMSFDEYQRATVYKRFREMPGDKGGEVRDAKEAKALSGKLDKLRAQAEKQCPAVRQVLRPGQGTTN
jgi:hypothetical protein